MIVEGKREATIRDADGEPFRIGVVPEVSEGGGVWGPVRARRVRARLGPPRPRGRAAASRFPPNCSQRRTVGGVGCTACPSPAAVHRPLGGLSAGRDGRASRWRTPRRCRLRASGARTRPPSPDRRRPAAAATAPPTGARGGDRRVLEHRRGVARQDDTVAHAPFTEVEAGLPADSGVEGRVGEPALHAVGLGERGPHLCGANGRRRSNRAVRVSPSWVTVPRSLMPTSVTPRKARMRIDVFTIFPAMVEGFAAQSLLGKARDRGRRSTSACTTCRSATDRPPPLGRRRARSAAAPAWC